MPRRTKDQPIRKSGADQQGSGRNNGPAALLRPLPFMWRIVESFASSVLPLLVLAVIAGFVGALMVELFEWAWEIVR